jgi:hypothetical protein
VFLEGPLVISVPARELANLNVPGSVFDIGVLRGAKISSELQVGIELIAAFDFESGASPNVRCIARPEIFTHGASLASLMKRLEGVREHICFTDGTALKLVPGLRNHLFAYGLQAHQRFVDFKKLTRRAPELLGQFNTQINSFHRVARDGVAFEPSPWLLSNANGGSEAPAWFHEFYLNPHSVEDSAERMLGWGTLDPPSFAEYAKIQYVPLTECAAYDEQFQQLLADIIVKTYFDPTACLLMRLPPVGTEITDTMRVMLTGIRGAHRRLPQTRAGNIFFLSGDIDSGILAELGSRLSWCVHHSVDFWRHPVSAYAASAQIIVFLDRQWTRASEAAKNLLAQAFGQAPLFQFPARSLDVDGFPE